ncbi:bifunctional [glutamine synthetase] adenylyltransferase/[glutamine synthetase]-adenylyl-L-tyrosine phosphorylase [Methylobacterium sp. NEAU K]|uniref:bifunctional [glutamine synthetase] adenylyltransferase/[glutamine synthetase]-adenylyl-L-tyrosine phosphorylase n=1 Tax=Methylobacterium sp. NEAU K TaxID=3064946 RepID=UPI002733BB5B|nr:bifunctional [glutamine synthetase] adenylyltransferase/[glutamine synthetase]-adenylyl-L-tyrosine phosphorylase [Methylobacterium sp. NEAU K]MDP4005264.1 bifunctional [glutamine synthetase] adenylyltransferase/[glutamine synthetase]-adenylyl-L-tyrosine phosphorylase [Methylobacterium sp. NEAU K]
MLPGPTLRESLRPSLRLTDPEAARDRLAAIEPAFAAGFLTPACRALLLGLADHSPFLWQAVTRSPERLAALMEQPPEAASRAIIARQRAVGGACGANPDLSEVGRRLRRNREAHALLVALADLGGCWDLDAVTRALSDFADASVNGATDALLRQGMAAGRFRPPDPEAPQVDSGLVILGLGKHGGRELNYSSDIDLVVFYEAERAAAVASADPKAFFVKLAQGLVKLLSERTADGYVHRIDYRLRPDPGSTAVALSTGFAFEYYQTLGQNWERAAFIKARPVAGDLPAGAAFLAGLAPFIWRRHFDFAAIAEIHAMKRQIHLVRGHDTITVAGHDIKIGRGGIREIEFFVQTQQLVFGGRKPELRGRGTVAMLARLVAEGWIDGQARDELTAAYGFLRTLEHRIQMVRDEQTQRLPTGDAALDALAAFAGFASREAFEAALLHHAGRVQAHYALLFETRPGDGSGEDRLVFGESEADPATLAALEAFGFRDPRLAWETVQGWHVGRRPALRAGRAREILAETLPGLLRALGGTADPDAALLTLDRAFARMPAVAELLAILRSHERLRLLFADILGTSPHLADTVSLSPHVLDTVLDPDFVAPAPDPEQVGTQYRALVGQPASHEEFLDRCRDATRQLVFVTGARLLSGIITPHQAGEAYSAIAEATIALNLETEGLRFARDHGAVPKGRCCVLALGRLGSRQLSAVSDLDLVFLYDFDPENRMSDGPRPVDAVVAYNRLAQRLYAALTTATRRGRLYAVDLRLRPYGSHSPPAVQLDGFTAYQRDAAEPWEHMALTRARVVAGDPELGAIVTARIAAVIAQPRDPAQVCAAAGAMRALVARERGHAGPHDLKLAPGGLFDLDFLAQSIVLGHAWRDGIGLSGAEVLRRAGACGLMPAAQAEPLAETYDFLDAVYQWQRLVLADPGSDPSASAARQIAKAVGLPDARSLAAELHRHRRRTCALLARIKRSVAATSGA